MEKDKLLKLFYTLREYLQKLQKESKASYMDTEHGLRCIDILQKIKEILPEHEYYLNAIIKSFASDPQQYFSRTFNIFEYIETLIQINTESEEVKERKFLKGAADKLKEAGISFDHKDYTSAINNLNTSIELALKDELDIPKTISKINTRKILDICIAESIGPVDYLKELIKHILDIDNKIKHQGYNPSKVDCINAITAVEDFLNKIVKYPFVANEEVKRKIFSGI